MKCLNKHNPWLVQQGFDLNQLELTLIWCWQSISYLRLCPPAPPPLPSDVLSPAVVSVSDSGPGQIRVSWGPLQPAQVQRYTVEYGAIPSGRVHTVMLHSQKSSAVLTGLEPGTQYLVTVSALHVNGKERAMSVRACTKEGTLSV